MFIIKVPHQRHLVPRLLKADSQKPQWSTQQHLDCELTPPFSHSVLVFMHFNILTLSNPLYFQCVANIHLNGQVNIIAFLCLSVLGHG